MVSKVYIFLIFMVLILPSLGLTRYRPPPTQPQADPGPVLADCSGNPIALKDKKLVNRLTEGFPGREGLILAVFILWKEVPVKVCVDLRGQTSQDWAAFRMEEDESVSHYVSVRKKAGG